FADQFSFLGYTLIKIILMVSTDFKLQLNSTLQSEKRKNTIFKRICSFIKVDRTFFFKGYLAFSFCRFKSLGNLCNSIATHLRAKLRTFLSKKIIAKIVQFNPIKFFFCLRNFSYTIASLGKGILEFKKSPNLLLGNLKLNCNGAFHGAAL